MKDNQILAISIVERIGGPKRFAQLTGAPIDTAKKYSIGSCAAPMWQLRLIEKALKRYFVK